jgi:hypothetical protein
MRKGDDCVENIFTFVFRWKKNRKSFTNLVYILFFDPLFKSCTPSSFQTSPKRKLIIDSPFLFCAANYLRAVMPCELLNAHSSAVFCKHITKCDLKNKTVFRLGDNSQTFYKWKKVIGPRYIHRKSIRFGE